jgi:hypothetical protein
VRGKRLVLRRASSSSSSSSWDDSADANEAAWEDRRQLAEIKAPEFYDAHGVRRHYFYHVNLSGRLFIEDVVPKNITSCLKSDKFLDFFFSRLRPNDTGLHLDYPLCSPCGREMNFIKPADPRGGIVLFDLDVAAKAFSFGATGRQPLDPASFALSQGGRLYHALSAHKHSEALGGMALVRSHTALMLCEKYIEFGDEEISRGATFVWEGATYPIRELA